MIAPRFPACAATALLLCLCLAAASADAQQYNQDCKPLPSPAAADDFKQFQGEIIRSYPPVGAGFLLADKVCQGKNYMQRLLSRQPDPDKVNLADAFEAAKPEVPPAISASEHYAEERGAEARITARAVTQRRAYLASNPANEAVAAANEREEQARLNGISTTIMLPPRNPDGMIALFEGKTSTKGTPNAAGDINGEGILSDADGLKEGTFKSGKLDGQGQQITNQGSWRGGSYQSDRLEGPGWEISRKNGKVVAIEGTFVGDKPDGDVLVQYADGSSRRQFWRDGKVFSEGALAAAGAQPSAPANPDAPWKKGARYRVAGNIEKWLDVANIDGKTYLVGNQWDGKRDGMMQRIFADGTVQYEEWEDGRSLQNGMRGSYAITIAPQPRGRTSRPAATNPSSASAGSGGYAPSRSNPGPPPAPGASYAGEFVVRDPVLPADFYSKYTGSGIAPNVLVQQSNGDPLLVRLASLMTSTSSMHLKLKYAIATLEGQVVIFRQSAVVPGGREQIQGMLQQRDASINTCRQISSDAGDCLSPIQ